MALALRVEVAGLDEAEALVETAGAIVPHPVAGEQLGRPLGADEPGDLVDNRSTDAAALMPLINEELPQEPRADDVRRIRRHVPAEHDEADRLAIEVHRAIPRVACGDSAASSSESATDDTKRPSAGPAWMASTAARFASVISWSSIAVMP